jgi:hypothetical protein
MLRLACIYITVALAAATIFFVVATAWWELATSPHGLPPGW